MKGERGAAYRERRLLSPSPAGGKLFDESPSPQTYVETLIDGLRSSMRRHGRTVETQQGTAAVGSAHGAPTVSHPGVSRARDRRRHRTRRRLSHGRVVVADSLSRRGYEQLARGQV